MHVTRPVKLKVIVTEDFKKEMETEMQAALERVNAQAQRLQFQMDAYVPELAKTDMNQAIQVRRALETEKQRYDDLKKEITQRVDEVNKLEIESEYERGELQSLVEVKPGDSFEDKMGSAEIVVKDGKVVEIRGD
ncbi:MAG: YlqD family protein [Armatimonadota bacterium]|nr:YlqD family protein [Armatimonadota bacterium]